MTKRIDPQLLAAFEAMAKDARALGDDDWGSERQQDAENAFFFATTPWLGGEGGDFFNWCLKATSEEMLDEALKRLRRAGPLEDMSKNQVSAVDQIDDLIELALNAACAAIQEKLGQTDGGLAGVYFCGEDRDSFDDAMRGYVSAELAAKKDREASNG